MAIYITGDTHGGFQRFGSRYFPQQKNMGREDYLIVTGDFGGLWDGGPKDQYWSLLLPSHSPPKSPVMIT